ncbi:MAG TPA: DUF1573 domain-containing protein [Gemmataceae bacterium]|jgi:hypothetical protein|nr:DUF1573 domain-containing protein [Gemmataceae bacterium]
MVHRTLFVLGFVAAAGAPLAAGEAEKFFSEKTKDFGTVAFGPTLVHHFKITNTTSQPVYIRGARVSCGCTSASIPVNTLRPGESTYMTAHMDTKRFIGPKEVFVYVDFSQPGESVTLSVKANRNDHFSKTAEALTMGHVRKGTEGSGSVQVTMRNDPSFEIRGAASATDFVTPTYKLLRRDRGEVVYELSATLKPGLDVGSWTTDVMFTTTSGILPTVRVPVTVDVVAAITATPASVQFPMVKVGDEKEMTVIVKGDKPFKITGVKGAEGAVDVIADTDEAKEAHTVRIVYKPTAAGDVSKTIVVQTDAGAEGKISIPVRGKAKMPE